MRWGFLAGLVLVTGGSALVSSAFAVLASPRVSEPFLVELPELEEPAAPPEDASLPPIELDEPTTLPAQREALYATLTTRLGISEEQLALVRAIFEASPVLGQGNPDVSRHPMTRSECRAIRAAKEAHDEESGVCGSRYMVPVFEPRNGERAEAARVCIDQFEFPDVPCEYPVVNVRANEAAALCNAVGKRICDAHEWEGACAGDLRPPEVEYTWGRARPYATWFHNTYREKTWSYGPERHMEMCGTGSRVTPGCPGGGWKECGSNTYPAGAFPDCVSPFGVYDLHGNAAEHMNLPLAPEELASRGGLGATEMKGSWFVFASTDAHEDDCRWRARDWHPSRVDNANSHRNYHLGFRCCQDRSPGEATR